MNSEPTSEREPLEVPSEPADAPAEAGDTLEIRETRLEVSLVLRIGAIVLVLLAGAGSMFGLMMLREAPAEAKKVERAVAVDTLKAQLEDVPVTVTGLGEVRALNVVSISAEVPGVVVEINPSLEVGEVVPAGALLFRVDQRDYIAARDQAEARVRQFEKTVERLSRQYEIDRERLRTLERNERLMEDEFKRVRDLFEQDEVGTRSAVDRAEMTFNQAADAHDQLGQQVALYPVQIQEAESGLRGARAQLEQAEHNLKRTEVRAAFDARVKRVNLEPGQYLNPGMEVLTLADDSMLEISVSLDSRDARDWLLFDEPGEGDTSWFGTPRPVECSIAWTEDPDGHRWTGVAHRVESFDPKTRTIALAIRVPSANALPVNGGLPLVEHMFCQVEIPGKTMEGVFRLPRWAVTYEGKVYLARDSRLVIQPVEVVRVQGEETFVRGGLNPGDEVIVTRLVNPLPNELLAVKPATAAQ